MKIGELLEIVQTAIGVDSENADREVEFYIKLSDSEDEIPIELDNVGQFGIIPDMTMTFEPAEGEKLISSAPLSAEQLDYKSRFNDLVSEINKSTTELLSNTSKIKNTIPEVHSIILIRNDKYEFIIKYVEDWDTYLFPSIKGNSIEELNLYYGDVKFLFDKIHRKCNYSSGISKCYHHYFYEVVDNSLSRYMSLKEIEKLFNVSERNQDIINFIREYYKGEGIDV